jgi:Asp-tRNA(Asn)/Glu-tRNA(Gln) amidotransferase A subunit family amidase
VRRVTAGSEGLPVAVQIAARPGRDDLVLSLLERVSGH